MRYVQTAHGYSERRACMVLCVNRCTARRAPPEARDIDLRQRLRELAEERRRFGALRLHIMLRREGLVQNHKRTERIYREENLSLRLRNRKKRLSHLRIIQAGPTGPNEQWSLDFMSDALMKGRRIRILTIVDLWDRSSPAIEVDVSLPGQRVVRYWTSCACKDDCHAGYAQIMAPSLPEKPWMPGHRNMAYSLNSSALESRWTTGTSKALMAASVMSA